jgi:hypothetical protein
VASKPFGPLNPRPAHEQIRLDIADADAQAAKLGWPARTSDVLLGDVIVLNYGPDRRLTVNLPPNARLS